MIEHLLLALQRVPELHRQRRRDDGTKEHGKDRREALA